MKRKVIKSSVLLSLLLVLVVSACSNNGNQPAASTDPTTSNNETGATAAPSTDPNAEKIELTVSTWNIQEGFDDPGAKNDTIANNMQEKFNLTLKPVQVTWDDWTEKYKIWATSNQLPDMFVNNLVTDDPGLYVTWAEQGIIKPLPEDMSKYPNLAKILELPSVQPLKLDGKYYMIPRLTYDNSDDWVLDRPIRYRKDWAAEAGYTSDPKSFDEFVAMTKAVLAKHPNAVGLAVNNNQTLLTHFLGSYPEMANIKSWVKEDNRWIPSYASSKVNQGVQELRSLYEQGILDKDFAIQKVGDGPNKFLNGQAFAVYGGGISLDLLNQFEKANPGVTAAEGIGLMSMWPAADGKKYTFAETPYWSEMFFRADLDDAKFDRALQLIDYMASEEFAVLVKNGIEGVDFKMENGKAVSLLTQDESLAKKYPIINVISYLGAWNQGFIYSGKQTLNTNPIMAAYEQLQIDTFNKLKAEGTPIPINFDVLLLSTPAKDAIGGLTATAMDDLYKVILGKEDAVTMWQNAVKSYDAKGLQEAITEVNAKAAELGIN
ncbi:extracellular solute-binding protein [Paenibacillus agaridevorans]|uniref:extracellular solute-binding protein n=1 Tax=Paenibacillus agaridevorans TaxID=171404 RepID=UPI001BE4693A|nr:extracellular solute-binding protein [Paenibacillus agaridevorans]